MNLSNCSLECGSSAGTKEAAELYLEKVGTNLCSFVGIIIYHLHGGRSSPGRVFGAHWQHGGHHGAQVGRAKDIWTVSSLCAQRVWDRA